MPTKKAKRKQEQQKAAEAAKQKAAAVDPRAEVALVPRAAAEVNPRERSSPRLRSARYALAFTAG